MKFDEVMLLIGTLVFIVFLPFLIYMSLRWNMIKYQVIFGG